MNKLILGMPSQRNSGLDALRCYAALSVLVGHYIWFVHGEEWSDLSAFLGQSGVQAFFVLSGFLIGTILLRAAAQPSFQTWRSFMLRRWARTLPLYWVVLLTLLLLSPPTTNPLAVAMGFATLTHNISQTAELRWFIVSWTLAVEEWFYLLFSALFLVTRLFVGRRADWPCIVFFIAAPLLGRVVAYYFRIDIGTQSVLWNLDGIAYGVAVALLRERHGDKLDTLAVPLAATGVALIWLAWHTYIVPWRSPLYLPWTFSLSCCGFAMLVPIILRARSFGAVNAPIRQLALHSYALYLIHLDLLLFLRGQIAPETLWGHIGLMVVWLVALAALCRVAFVCIELPAMRWAARRTEGTNIASFSLKSALDRPA